MTKLIIKRELEEMSEVWTVRMSPHGVPATDQQSCARESAKTFVDVILSLL